MKILFLISIFCFSHFSFFSYAEEQVKVEPIGTIETDPVIQIKREEYQLDWKYRAGEYLIYDCERSHYACVSKDGQNNCLEERKFALESKSDKYPCTPLKKFDDKKSCIQKGYQLVDVNAIKRFCFPKK